MDDRNILSLTLDNTFFTQHPPRNRNEGILISKLSTQEQPGSSTTGIITSTDAKPKDSISTKASDWVQDYTSTSISKQRELRESEQRPTKIGHRGMNVPYSTGQSGARRCQGSRIPNMMMSQMEIMEKGRSLVGLNLASMSLGPVISPASPVFRSPSAVHRVPSPVSRWDWVRRSTSPSRRHSPSPARHRSPSPSCPMPNGGSSGSRGSLGVG